MRTSPQEYTSARHNPEIGIMGRFMGTGRVIALGVTEEFDAGQMDAVGRDDVTGLVTAMNHLCAGRVQEAFGTCDALDAVRWRSRLAVIVLRQSVDLLDVENNVTLHEGNGALAVLAAPGVRLGADDLVGINDEAALLAPADMGIQFPGLPEGHPDRRGVASLDRCRPQHQDVDTPIRGAVRAQRPRDASRAVLDLPRLLPRRNTLL